MMIVRFLAVLAACLGAGLLAPGPAVAEKRIALVIGNSAYQHVAHLQNPARDADAMAALLGGAGYVVDVRRDLDIRQLRGAVGAFAEQARDADRAIVFYAGHGIEVDGVNYLIPVDARLERDFDVEDETLSLDRLLRLIEPAHRLRLVVLDACRDNPFTRTMKRTVASRSIGRGLARVEPTIADTLVAFATEAGLVAADGDAANSPFTSALVKHVATPGLDVRLAFGRVRDEVMRETANRQRPFVYGSLGGSTVAIIDAPADLPSPAAEAVTAPSPCGAAETHWRSAEAIGTVAVLEDHRKRFAHCPFAVLAQARIDALQRQAAVPEQQPRSSKDGVASPARIPRCVVADPTGTPLNVRRSPNGQLTGARLRNGTAVQIASRSADSQGRPWALISIADAGGQKRLGYVFMEFITCEAP